MNFKSILDYVTEPDLGESDVVLICFTAKLHRAFDKSSIMNIDALEQGIFAVNISIRLSLKTVTIPSSFIGIFNFCLNATVIGNNEFNGNKIISWVFRAQSDPTAISPCNSLLIYDNDG